MKKIILIFFLLCFVWGRAFSQYIKKIAVFNSNTISYSGIYGIADTAVYNYSNYYHEWLPLSNDGLVRINNIVQLSSIAVYNDGTGTTEGLYVISDTAVFYYQWYYQTWVPLSNTGLIRHQDTVQLSDISLFQYEAGSNDGVFVVSDTAVFQYSWYEHLWYPLSNAGLYSTEKMMDKECLAVKDFPNPFRDEISILYTLPANYNNIVRIALFDAKGCFINELVNEKQEEGQHIINLKAAGIEPGIYFYEICGNGFWQAKRVIKIE